MPGAPAGRQRGGHRRRPFFPVRFRPVGVPKGGDRPNDRSGQTGDGPAHHQRLAYAEGPPLTGRSLGDGEGHLVGVGGQCSQPHQQPVEPRPRRRFLAETVRGDTAQRFDHAVQRGRIVYDLICRHIGAVRVEGAAPRGREHQHRREREDIRLWTHFARRTQLLRGHEGRRAHDAPRHGQGLVVRSPRDTEVDDAWAFFRQHDIGGLEVTVHYPHAVDVAQRLGQPDRQLPQLRAAHRAMRRDPLGERGSGHVRGRHPGERRVRVRVHDRCGERPTHPPGRRDLLLEPQPELVVIGELLVHHLQRDPTPRFRAGQIHRAHAARAEPVLQLVAADGVRVSCTQHHQASPARHQMRHHSRPNDCASVRSRGGGTRGEEAP